MNFGFIKLSLRKFSFFLWFSCWWVRVQCWVHALSLLQEHEDGGDCLQSVFSSKPEFQKQNI